MNKYLNNSLFLLAFSTALGGGSAHAEYSQTINSIVGEDISYKNDQGETVYVKDSGGNNLKYHSSAYEVNQVGKDDAYDFKIYTGLDENNIPQFEYYTYSLNGAGLAPNSITNITKLAEAPEGGTCNATNNCFKVAKGVGEDSYSTYDYYTYELRADGEEYQSSEKVKSPIGGNVEDLRFVGITSIAQTYGYGAVEVRKEHVDLIKADFVDNIVDASYSYGAAINMGGEAEGGASISDIVGDFIGNRNGDENVDGFDHSWWARGGAIHARGGNVSSITGNFVGNRSVEYNTCYGTGGAIWLYQAGDIKSIVGDFIGNWAGSVGWSQNSASSGGALYISNTNVETITGDFINNYVHEGYMGAIGGAIASWGALTNLTGNFINNHTTSSEKYSRGGALYISGSMTTLKGNFVGNYASAYKSYAQGGAIVMFSTIDLIEGNFVENYAYSESAGVYGGAIINFNTIKNLTGNFINNRAVSSGSLAYGGAIFSNKETTKIIGDFVGNYAEGDGAVAGALYNYGLIETLSGSFLDNHAKGVSGAYGGAIYNEADDALDTYLGIVADGNGTNGYKKSILFKGNYIEDAEGNKEYEAIYNAADAVLNFSSEKGGTFTFYDYINGDDTAKVYFDGDGDGTFNLYNDIKGQAKIEFKAAYVLNMLSPDDIHGNTSKASVISAKNITIAKAIAMAVDVDLANVKMDGFAAENFTINDDAGIDVNKIVIVSDAAGGIGETTYVPFVALTEDGEGNKIGSASGLDKISTDVEEASSSLYIYSVYYNHETGKFEFTKTGKVPQPSPVGPTPEEETGGTEAAASVAMAQTSVEAVSAVALNRDLTMTIGLNSGDAENLSTWVQAFGSKDDVEMKHVSDKVDTQFHGIIGGIDSKKFTYNNGVNVIYGIFGSYIDGKQKHNGNRTDVKGVYAGVRVAFRKDAVFSNTIVNGGYLRNEANSEFGKDKFNTKVVSVSNKTGVDIKKKGTTFTPSVSLNYMGIDTDDYTTKAGAKIESHFMNVFTVAPELKVAKDFGEGLDGYAKVAYKMFFYDNNKVKANDIILPSMSVKPYVEYGVGLKKDWSQEEWNAKDVTSYAEITRHDGGREGWNIDLGLKFDF